MSVASRPVLRLLVHDELPGPINMGLDEALLQGTGSGWQYTLRLYRWSLPTVSLGYGQPWREGYDPSLARRERIDLVRRRTGGRAVLHADELTYSVTGPEDPGPFEGGVQATYRVISEGLVAGLRSLGAEVDMVRSRGRQARAEPGACFGARALYEITAGGRKLLGSAQRRQRGRVLQHGSLPLGRPDRRLWAVLGPTGVPAAAESVGLVEALGRRPSLRRLTSSLGRGVAARFGMELVAADLSHAERVVAQRCARRYRDCAFTYRR